MRTKRGFICGMKTNSVVKIDQAIMGGEPCFAGTRVPARTLIDYLEGGDTIDQLTGGFPDGKPEAGGNPAGRSQNSMV